jgi:hypothetical protein
MRSTVIGAPDTRGAEGHAFRLGTFADSERLRASRPEPVS